jgi:hypothetical protein
MAEVTCLCIIYISLIGDEVARKVSVSQPFCTIQPERDLVNRWGASLLLFQSCYRLGMFCSQMRRLNEETSYNS